MGDMDNDVPSRNRIISTGSEYDIPNETGNTAHSEDDSVYNELQESIDNFTAEDLKRKWENNYHEAAIFLEEGENNDKFTSHPRNQDALPAYLIVHNKWYYLLDLFASLLLLALAVVESPSSPLFTVPIWVHGSVEILALFIIGIELVMKLRWQGWRFFIRHTRTMIKASSLLIMFIEAIVVLVRQSNHFRVTRAIRPIFIIDNRYFGGVRRFIRQVFLSLPPILDMLGLMFFFMVLFSIMGFFLFSPDDSNPNFTTLNESFISLFVLLTTSNFPDVMMPSYAKSRWSAIFFILYLVIVLYFFMNLMLAVVYNAFTIMEKDKLRKLLIHKIKATQHAFRLLVNKRTPTRIGFRHFEGLMKFYSPKKDRQEVYLVFKALDVDGSMDLTLEEFNNFYEANAISWKKKKSVKWWYENFPISAKVPLTYIRLMVTSKAFEYFMYLFVLVNGVCLLIETSQLSRSQETYFTTFFSTKWYHLLFIIVYTVEAVLKILGLGPEVYFCNGWNVYDFILTTFAIIGMIGEYFGLPLFYAMIVRPMRLLSVFQKKRRFRDVFGTLVILLPRMISAAIVLLVLYYFFAIIGMELFAGYEMKNCCKNTIVEDFYRYDNVTNKQGYYYLNNFDDIFSTGVTLFELTVVNNWFIIMEGYVSVTNGWSRIYFMTFNIITMVVMTIVVAFILEGFLFRIQSEQMDCLDEENFIMDAVLSCEEYKFCKENILHENYEHNTENTRGSVNGNNMFSSNEDQVVYRGIRPRNKHTLSMKMYQDEVKEWLRAVCSNHIQNESANIANNSNEWQSLSS